MKTVKSMKKKGKMEKLSDQRETQEIGPENVIWYFEQDPEHEKDINGKVSEIEIKSGIQRIVMCTLMLVSQL